MLTTRAINSAVLAKRPRWTGGGLAVLLAFSILASGWLIVRGHGLLAAGGLILAIFYLAILVRWQRGVYGLLLYLPVAGVVTLSLYPWSGVPFLNPVLYKDWLFVFPTYLGFLAAVVLRRQDFPRIGRVPTILLGAFSLLVAMQMANPGVQNAMMALIGAKVWLLYLPLYPLSFALVASRRDLCLLLRLLVSLAAIPCAVGIAEYASAKLLGYQGVMNAVYGPAAAQVTQGFTYFEVGGGLLARIPSTFTFVTQYFAYTLTVMVPCYAVWRADPSPRWRAFGKLMLGVTAIACFLSGARSAFVFAPLLLGLMYGLDRGFSGIVSAGVYIAGVLIGALAISRVAAGALFSHVSELLSSYAVDTAYGGLVQAVVSSPLGTGTGTNTGSARYALSNPELFTAIENYYGKVVHELGIPGLLLIWGLFAFFLWQAQRARRQLADTGLRSIAAAVLAFFIMIVLNSFKGWLIDLEPLNIYLWVLAGVLGRLSYLDSRSETLTPHPILEGR